MRVCVRTEVESGLVSALLCCDGNRVMIGGSGGGAGDCVYVKSNKQ